MACPRFQSCQLANGISTREALRVWQSFYCDGLHARCERFKLAEAGSEVPIRLLPNGRLQDESVGAARFEPSRPAVLR